MNNAALRREAAECGLDSPDHEALRLSFGLACVERVKHLFEAPLATTLYRELAHAVQARLPLSALARAAAQGESLARSHPGSTSIDGSGHSAVTATHALARALAGRAVDAAEYAAYALVYSYGRYAVGDPDAFAGEFQWQVRCLQQLREREAVR